MSYSKPKQRPTLRYKGSIYCPGGFVQINVHAKSRETCQLLTSLTAMRMVTDRTPSLMLLDKQTGAEWAYVDSVRGKNRIWRRV